MDCVTMDSPWNIPTICVSLTFEINFTQHSKNKPDLPLFLIPKIEHGLVRIKDLAHPNPR